MNRCQIAFALIAIFMTLGGCASMSDDNWVETDDLSSVKQYLAADKGRLHQRDAKGKTILHLAAEKGRTDIVIYLLQEGASPDAQDHNGDSPLQFAAYEGYLDITTLLIESGANINSVNRYGVTPLLNSLFNKKYEIARVLVLKGADVNFKSRNGNPALHVAAKDGNLEFVQFLVSHGANVRASGQFNAEPLHFAAEYGNLTVVEYLVSNGAEVNAKNTYGKTPLHEAVLNNHFEVVKYLTRHRADYRAKDVNGSTPIMLARNAGNRDIEYFLASLSMLGESPGAPAADQGEDYSGNSRREPVMPATADPSKLDFGSYHALVIGNDEYRHLRDLKSAKNDAREVARVLQGDYGFQVELLLDATRTRILLALNRLRSQMTVRDNLLIYYAGHGWLDKEGDEGYWLPVDAERQNTVNWVSNSSITTMLKAMKAKHVLIVADSCYSGKLSRGLHVVDKSPDYLSRIAQKKARSVLSSGGLEPVLDSGGKANHSVFASAFLDALKENKNVMDATELFSAIRRPVILNSDQTPEYSDIRKAGHDGGDFIFCRRK